MQRQGCQNAVLLLRNGPNSCRRNSTSCWERSSSPWRRATIVGTACSARSFRRNPCTSSATILLAEVQADYRQCRFHGAPLDSEPEILKEEHCECQSPRRPMDSAFY